MQQHEEFIRSISQRIEEAKQRPVQESAYRHIIFLLGGVRYAIPMHLVLEVVRTPPLTPIPGARAYVQGIFFHRGAVMPVIDILKRFPSGETPLRVPEHVIIVKSQGVSCGFLVEHVVDALECHPETLKPLSEESSTHLPSPYLLGTWEHHITTKEAPFHYEFLIAGPSIQEKYHEDSGERLAFVPTHLMSVERMIGALENDVLESMLQ